MRTGLQTLEDEKRAIKDITVEMEEDQDLNNLARKDIETIQSKYISTGLCPCSGQ